VSTLQPLPGCPDRRKVTSRKVIDLGGGLGDANDSLATWTQRYLDLAVRGVRSDEVTGKIARHLDRFAAWFTNGYGHDRVSAVTPREVAAWRDHWAAEGTADRDGTTAPMAPATVNNHLAHLSALFSWIRPLSDNGTVVGVKEPRRAVLTPLARSNVARATGTSRLVSAVSSSRDSADRSRHTGGMGGSLTEGGRPSTAESGSGWLPRLSAGLASLPDACWLQFGDFRREG
jgi:hypothetical protein